MIRRLLQPHCGHYKQETYMTRPLTILAALALLGAASPAFAHGGGMGHSTMQMATTTTDHGDHSDRRDRHDDRIDHRMHDDWKKPNKPLSVAQINKAINFILGKWQALAQTYLTDLQSGNKAGANRTLRELTNLSMLGNKVTFSVSTTINGHTIQIGALDNGRVKVDGKFVRS
jgi:hypothetical protein